MPYVAFALYIHRPYVHVFYNNHTTGAFDHAVYKYRSYGLAPCNSHTAIQTAGPDILHPCNHVGNARVFHNGNIAVAGRRLLDILFLARLNNAANFWTTRARLACNCVRFWEGAYVRNSSAISCYKLGINIFKLQISFGVSRNLGFY